MALVFADGFDAIKTSGTFNPRKWWQNAAPTGNEIVAGRIGGFACRCRHYLQTNIFTAQTTYVVGCAFQPRSIPTTSFGNMVFAFCSDICVHLYLAITPCLQLALFRDGPGTSEVLLGVGPNVLKLNEWYYVEMKALADSGTSGFAEVRLGGVTEINVTGIKTTGDDPLCAGAAVSFDNFLWKGDTNIVTRTSGSPFTVSVNALANGPYIDDIYICDTTGSFNNDFLGDIYVETLLPDGAGNSSGWTPLSGSNYQNVDEQAVDDDTTYVSTNTATTTDTYTYSNLAVNTTVNAVQTVAVARFDDGGPHSIAHVARPGGTDNIGTTQAMPFYVNGGSGGSYLDYFEPWDVNPDTAAAWTAAQVNASEFGIRLIS